MDSHPNLFPLCQVSDDIEGFESYKDMEESRAVKHVEELKPENNAVVLNLAKDFEELKSKLNTVDLKLKEVSSV